jgi:hypothetical protein
VGFSFSGATAGGNGGAAGNSGFFGDEYVEAPALFRRQVAGLLAASFVLDL